MDRITEALKMAMHWVKHCDCDHKINFYDHDSIDRDIVLKALKDAVEMRGVSVQEGLSVRVTYRNGDKIFNNQRIYSLGYEYQPNIISTDTKLMVEEIKIATQPYPPGYKAKGKIKYGAPVSQDFGYGHWPATKSGESVDTDMIFDVEWSGTFWKCVAPGFGELSTGNYGNGSIYVSDIQGVDVIENNI